MSDLLALENQLCFRLYRLNKRMAKMYAPLLSELDLTYPQYLVMLALWQKSPELLTVKQLGNLLELDSGTLSPLLKRMIANGLINKTRSESDERAVLIALTTKGHALKEAASQIPLKMCEKTYLTEDEFTQLTGLLDKLIKTTQ